MRRYFTALLGALLLALSFSSSATAAQPYSAVDLLQACTEADNDARWGEVAELECEQYIMGFVHALLELKEGTVCPPVQNTADEVRWAYMRWVHADYGAHKDMTAGSALLQTLREKFGCN